VILAAGVLSAQTIFDEIKDAQERAAFRNVWDAREPAVQKQLAVRFADQYPRSILLKEAYELAARAFVATGDYGGGLYWAQRSLRLMPENPFLLVMVADVAVKRSQPELAERSARDALHYLSDAAAPEPIAPQEWPRVRGELRSTANVVLAHLAAAGGRNADAEQLLAVALAENPDNLEAAYVLGVVRAALQQEDEAASAFARVVRANGELADAARRALRPIFEHKMAVLGMTFDEYVASVKWTAPAIEQVRKSLSPALDRYAGSSACRECHARQYASWQTTGMANMMRPYRAADVIGDFSGRTMVEGNARPLVEGGRHFIEIRKGDSAQWVRYPVDFIIGSKWQQAYATQLPDGRLLVFPIQYSRIRSGWVNYWEIVDVRGTGRTDISRFHEIPEDAVYQNTCASCHTSQLKFDKGAANAAGATFREGGVNCEMCHGPSLSHVERMKQPPNVRQPLTGTPLAFARLTAAESVAVCAQCHSQSAVHDTEAGGAANYSEEGPAFYRTYTRHLPSDFSRTAFYRDGRYRATTFIAEAFTRSQCFRKGGATCASCHDPHPVNTAGNPTSLKFGRDADDMCVQCHTSLRERPESHTRHAAGSEASRCVSCHMPRIQEALLFQARSHQIDDIPDVAMTARFGQTDSPNACLICHGDKTVEWLTTATRNWKPSGL